MEILFRIFKISLIRMKMIGTEYQGVAGLAGWAWPARMWQGGSCRPGCGNVMFSSLRTAVSRPSKEILGLGFRV
jgi:hypothetical protein